MGAAPVRTRFRAAHESTLTGVAGETRGEGWELTGSSLSVGTSTGEHRPPLYESLVDEGGGAGELQPDR